MGMIYRNNVAYGSETRVELTQAEYDALTTEQKMNGTAYYITDGEPSILSDYQTKDDNTLTTSNKTVVGGINEVNSLINTMSTTVSGLSSSKQDKNDSSLATTNKTVVGGINELVTELSSKIGSGNITYGSTQFVASRAEFLSLITSNVSDMSDGHIRVLSVRFTASDGVFGTKPNTVIIQRLYGNFVNVAVPSVCVSGSLQSGSWEWKQATMSVFSW